MNRIKVIQDYVDGILQLKENADTNIYMAFHRHV